MRIVVLLLIATGFSHTFSIRPTRVHHHQPTTSLNLLDLPSIINPDFLQALHIVPPLSSLPPLNILVPTISLSFLSSSLLLNVARNKSYSSPYPTRSYDASAAATYFSTRPFLQLYRSAQISLLSSSFIFKVLDDNFISKPPSSYDSDLNRGRQLSKLLTTLGPTFIKVGQSLSTRSDILSPGYCAGLASLQDAVQPFPTPDAFAQIEKSFKISSVYDVFKTITPEPVAAASLGQVYKATLLSDDSVVAVKVQRSDVVKQIALDMHLIRSVAPIVKMLFKVTTDLVETTDTWGRGFVDETDYLKEGRNAMQFNKQISKSPLNNVVFAPDVVEHLTTSNILTTQWIDGERLDKYEGEDVSKFCSVAMNCYLTMLLDQGLLHCDPHPGNLLVFEDRLCILDWGLVTNVNKELQVTLIEHVAHLVSKDYAAIPDDLVKLDFVPASMVEKMKEEGVVELLADIYSQWGDGGGAANIDVNQVVGKVKNLTQKGEGSIFKIPPYFLYIAKSFSVLEGIGLSNDKGYSIINECLPYVSKRLLSDKDERVAGALNSFIFGSEKDDKDRVVDIERLEKLAGGFGSYSKSAAGSFRSDKEILDEQASMITDLLLNDSDEENPFVELLLEQGAKFLSANVRKVYQNARKQSGMIGKDGRRSALGFLIDPLGLWRDSVLVKLDDVDMRVLRSQERILDVVGQLTPKEMSNEDKLRLGRAVLEKLVEKRGLVAKNGGKLATYIVKQTSERLKKGAGGGNGSGNGEERVNKVEEEEEERGEVRSVREMREMRESRRNLKKTKKDVDIPIIDVEFESERLQRARAILKVLEDEKGGKKVTENGVGVNIL